MFFIMAMSIARGYGNFDVENVLVAFFILEIILEVIYLEML